MGELEDNLPAELKGRALQRESEIVLPYAEALAAIKIATRLRIAVLGVDAFEVRKNGLLTVGLTDASARVRFTGDWDAYVAAMNTAAERWIVQHRLGESHGYILTSASQKEFASLKARRSP